VHSSEVRAAVPHIDWRKLYEAAMLEMNPDKLSMEEAIFDGFFVDF